MVYVLLNLEYEYRGDVEKDVITPDEYFRDCGRFFASPEQRCALGNRMIEIATELCRKGIGYRLALNCLKSAVRILEEAAKKNRCYKGDLKVADSMKKNLEHMLPQIGIIGN